MRKWSKVYSNFLVVETGGSVHHQVRAFSHTNEMEASGRGGRSNIRDRCRGQWDIYRLEKERVEGLHGYAARYG